MGTQFERFRTQASRLTRHPRTRKIAIWIASPVAAFGILGALVAPPIIRSQLSKILSEKLHRDVSIEQIRINPYAMTVAVRGFLIKERGGSAAVISFDELYGNLEIESIFRWGPVFKELRLVKPYVNLVRNEDLTYNFQDLIDDFASAPAGESSGPPPRFSLNNIELINGKIDFDDRPEQTKHTISSLNIGVPFISSFPSHTNIYVKPSFSAVINGSPLNISGETKPFSNSLESSVNLDLEKVQIPKYLEYSPVPLNFKVSSGQLDGKLNASFKASKNGLSVFSITGNLSLTGLSVRQNESDVLNLPKMDVVIDSIGIFAKKARLRTVNLEGMELHVTRSRDGKLNLANLAAAPRQNDQSAVAAEDAKANEAQEKTTQPFIFAIDRFLLEKSTLYFDDRTPQRTYKTKLNNVRLDVKGLTNEADRKADVEFSFETNAKESLRQHGTVQLTPLSVEGDVEIKGFKPGGLGPYLQETSAGKINQGVVDLSTRYSFARSGERPRLKLSDLNVRLQKLRLDLPGQPEPLGRIGSVAIRNAAIDIEEKSVTVGLLEGKDGSGYLRRESDGTWNYARLVKKPAEPPAVDESKKTGGSSWKIKAKQIVLDRFRINFDDRSATTPAKLNLSDVSLKAANFSNAKNNRGKLTFHARVNDKGILRVDGSAGADPLLVRLAVEGQGLEIVPFQPYLESRVNFLVTDGRAGAKGELRIDESQDGAPKVNFEGSLQVSDFATVEKTGARDLLKWRLLALDGLKFASEPLLLRISEINLADFYSRIIIGANGKINLQDLTADRTTEEKAEGGEKLPEKTSAKAPPDTATPQKSISIGKITLEGGNINFSDFFVKPNYSANLTGVQGTIAELKPEAPGDLALKAKLDDAAPVDIRGKINPLAKELFMDIKAKASDIEMRPLSPYSGKYVGYEIEKGKLTFNVQYKLENRKLNADTRFILNQLTFGEKVDSPDATSLPVMLAIALLKNRNGVIDVGLPVTGSLDEPRFSVGGLVLKLIFNIIRKAVTAPFALLGAAFGGGGEELSYIEFDYGRAALAPSAEEKIKTLATAMVNRPALKLELAGRIDPINDRAGLRRAKVEQKVKAQKMKELLSRGAPPKSLDDVKIDKSEYERYLRAAYGEETFPKPRNFIGFAKTLPVPEMENLMLNHTQVTDDDLRELANRRATTARDRLLSIGKIAADRLFIVAPKPATGDEKNQAKAKSSRVDFSLR